MTNSVPSSSITETGRIGRDCSDDEAAELDETELLAELDDQFELSGLRERRLEELRKEITKNQKMSEDNHGRYVEIKDEKKLIQITAKTERSLVHFFHPDFERCKTMDKKLEELASKFFSTRFLRVDVANVPWLVEKLQIKVLPCVIGFLEGISRERIVGFEGITGESSKEINGTLLESRLKQAGIIKDQDNTGSTRTQHNQRVRFSSAKIRSKDSDEEESDWDD